MSMVEPNGSEVLSTFPRLLEIEIDRTTMLPGATSKQSLSEVSLVMNGRTYLLKFGSYCYFLPSNLPLPCAKIHPSHAAFGNCVHTRPAIARKLINKAGYFPRTSGDADMEREDGAYRL